MPQCFNGFAKHSYNLNATLHGFLSLLDSLKEFTTISIFFWSRDVHWLEIQRWRSSILPFAANTQNLFSNFFENNFKQFTWTFSSLFVKSVNLRSFFGVSLVDANILYAVFGIFSTFDFCSSILEGIIYYI